MEGKKKGRWVPGESGNPKGRPRGSNSSAELRAAISAHIPAILDRLAQLAVEGDVSAARLLLERTIPATRPVEAAVGLMLPSGLTAKGEAILNAVADGEIAPGQAATLVGALLSVSKLKEVDDLEERVKRLEDGL